MTQDDNTLVNSAICVSDIGRFVMSAQAGRSFGTRSVRPWSRIPPLAGREELPQRHQLDYTICWPVLRSVNCTAAPNANLQLQADDATDASLSGGGMRSVGTTEASKLLPQNRVRR